MSVIGVTEPTCVRADGALLGQVMLFGALVVVTGAQPTLLQVFHAWGCFIQLQIKTCVRVDPLCSVSIHTLCQFCGNAAFSLLLCGSCFFVAFSKISQKYEEVSHAFFCT